jgi:hypothetical protein
MAFSFKSTTIPAEIVAGTSNIYDAQADSNAVDPVNYEFDFDGDGTVEREFTEFSGDGSLSFTFEKVGQFDITITATDDNGDTATTVETVSVSNPLTGSGTATDPYQIRKASELPKLRFELDATYVLTRDIDASVLSGFIPLGKQKSGNFTGTLNGQGNNINGLTINLSNVSRVGLFSRNGGSIQNLGITNADITGNERVGTVAGSNSGTISQSFSTGSVEATAGISNVGGLVGKNAGTVKNASAKGDVTGDFRVGGLVGQIDGGTVENASASGNVTGNFEVGGLVGLNNGGTVENASASGSVIGDNEVGGLVGFSTGDILNASASGSVTGSNNEVGGLVGENNGGTVENAFASGSVTGSEDVGGLVGANGDGTVEFSYFDSTESGTGLTTAIGADFGSSTELISLTTSDMQGDNAETNMDNLDFQNTWKTVTGDYPELRSNRETQQSQTETFPSLNPTTNVNTIVDGITYTGFSFKFGNGDVIELPVFDEEETVQTFLDYDGSKYNHPVQSADKANVMIYLDGNDHPYLIFTFDDTSDSGGGSLDMDWNEELTYENQNEPSGGTDDSYTPTSLETDWFSTKNDGVAFDLAVPYSRLDFTLRNTLSDAFHDDADEITGWKVFAGNESRLNSLSDDLTIFIESDENDAVTRTDDIVNGELKFFSVDPECKRDGRIVFFPSEESTRKELSDDEKPLPFTIPLVDEGMNVNVDRFDDGISVVKETEAYYPDRWKGFNIQSLLDPDSKGENNLKALVQVRNQNGDFDTVQVGFVKRIGNAIKEGKKRIWIQDLAKNISRTPVSAVFGSKIDIDGDGQKELPDVETFVNILLDKYKRRNSDGWSKVSNIEVRGALNTLNFDKNYKWVDTDLFSGFLDISKAIKFDKSKDTIGDALDFIIKETNSYWSVEFDDRTNEIYINIDTTSSSALAKREHRRRKFASKELDANVDEKPIKILENNSLYNNENLSALVGVSRQPGPDGKQVEVTAEHFQSRIQESNKQQVKRRLAFSRTKETLKNRARKTLYRELSGSLAGEVNTVLEPDIIPNSLIRVPPACGDTAESTGLTPLSRYSVSGSDGDSVGSVERGNPILRDEIFGSPMNFSNSPVIKDNGIFLENQFATLTGNPLNSVFSDGEGTLTFSFRVTDAMTDAGSVANQITILKHFGKQDGQKRGFAFALQKDGSDSDNRPDLKFQKYDDSGAGLIKTFSSIPLDSRVQVSMTVDNTGIKVRLHKTLSGGSTDVTTKFPEVGSLRDYSPDAENIVIGSDGSNDEFDITSSTEKDSTGVINELRGYDESLTETQIRSLFENPEKTFDRTGGNVNQFTVDSVRHIISAEEPNKTIIATAKNVQEDEIVITDVNVTSFESSNLFVDIFNELT